MQIRQHGSPPPTGGSARPADSLSRRRRDLEDVLSAASDRPELERLYDRRVKLPEILKLVGREVSPSRIIDLLESPDLTRDLRKLLGS